MALAGVTGPDGRCSQAPASRWRWGRVWHSGTSLGGWSNSHTCAQEPGNYQSHPGRARKGADPSGIKARLAPPDKEPRPAKAPAKGPGNTGWGAEEGGCKNRCDHVTTCKQARGL